MVYAAFDMWQASGFSRMPTRDDVLSTDVSLRDDLLEYAKQRAFVEYLRDNNRG